MKRKELLSEAERLADALTRYRTPNSAEPVDPSRLKEVLGYLKSVATTKEPLKELGAFLDVMPGSYLSKMSRSAGPQLNEIRSRVTPLLRKGYSAKELMVILGWALRLLQTDERLGSGRSESRR